MILMHLLHFLRTIHFTLDIKLPHNHEAINVHKKAGPLGNGQFFFFTVYSMSLNKMCWFVLFCKGMITFLQHFILLLFFFQKMTVGQENIQDKDKKCCVKTWHLLVLCKKKYANCYFFQIWKKWVYRT